MDDDYDEAHEAVKGAFRSITGMKYVYVDILKLNLTSMPTWVLIYISATVPLWHEVGVLDAEL